MPRGVMKKEVRYMWKVSGEITFSRKATTYPFSAFFEEKDKAIDYLSETCLAVAAMQGVVRCESATPMRCCFDQFFVDDKGEIERLDY